MVDGDGYRLSDLMGKFNGGERLLYFETKANDVHPFYFLTGLCDTFRFQLEEFSIAKFASVLTQWE
jgi:hypothetical protein